MSQSMQQARRSVAKQERFDALTRHLLPDLYRYAFWLSRDHLLAQDVVQESLLRAWQAFDSLKDEGSAMSWLFTIVRRENARMYARKPIHTVDIDVLDYYEQVELSTTVNTDVDDIRGALAQLDDGYREPLLLQALIGHTMKEIAEIMGLTPNTVCIRLFRAREKLRAILSKPKRLKPQRLRQPYRRPNFGLLTVPTFYEGEC